MTAWLKLHWAEIRLYLWALFVAVVFCAGFRVGELRSAERLAQYKATSADAAVQAQAKFQASHTAMETQFNALSAKYEEATRAKPPAVADSVVADVDHGTLRLRDADVCAASRQAAAATARSRALDAAATQALADRVAHSIAAVRAGDAADDRERQLGAQVIGLQGVLDAERK